MTFLYLSVRDQRLRPVVVVNFIGCKERIRRRIAHHDFGLSLLRCFLPIAIGIPSGITMGLLHGYRRHAIGAVIIRRCFRLTTERCRSATRAHGTRDRNAAILALFDRGRFVDRFDDAEIMFGMLQIMLRRDTVAGGLRVTRQSLIFLVHLPRITAHAQIVAVAIKRLMPQRCRRAWPVVDAATHGRITPTAPHVTITMSTPAMSSTFTTMMATTRRPAATIRSLSHNYSSILKVTLALSVLHRHAVETIPVRLKNRKNFRRSSQKGTRKSDHSSDRNFFGFSS